MKYFKILPLLFLTPLTWAATDEGSYRLPIPNILNPASPQAEEIEGLFWLVAGFSVFRHGHRHSIYGGGHHRRDAQPRRTF